jgi:hypothetical protein
MNARHLRELVIRPTLQRLQLWSESAEELLLGTAAQESRCGEYLEQLGHGPALGIFQMESATHDDIWSTYLGFREQLKDRVVSLLAQVDLALPLRASWESLAHQMVWNLAYATAMARLRYLRDRQPLPPAEDIAALAATWKRCYNSRLGKGTENEFVANYRRYIGADVGGTKIRSPGGGHRAPGS